METTICVFLAVAASGGCVAQLMDGTTLLINKSGQEEYGNLISGP